MNDPRVKMATSIGVPVGLVGLVVVIMIILVFVFAFSPASDLSAWKVSAIYGSIIIVVSIITAAIKIMKST